MINREMNPDFLNSFLDYKKDKISKFIKDDKLSKLLLYMYLKEKDNGKLIRKLK